MRRLLPLVVVALLPCAACEDPPPPEVVFGEAHGLPACDQATVDANPDKRCFTWRAVAGVSMGGGTASRLGFSEPSLYDVVGVMGTPFADTEFFFGMLERSHLSGFCSKEVLEAALAAGQSLDDPSNPALNCGIHDVWPLPEDNPQQARPGYQVAVEDSDCAMFQSDYNHWYRGPDEGRGGGFTRNGLIEIVHDLLAAYGNLLYFNPESNYFPPGVDEGWHVAPHSADEAQVQASLCANPRVIPNFYNAEWNPEGTYNAITFCDGSSGRSGDYDPLDPQARSIPVEFAVALDMNGNGVRDWAEPVLINNRERWRDLGADGLASVEEPGYDHLTNPDPSGDDFDTLKNPTGAEANLRHDEGESYDDFGLDGVAATGDFGEGNGGYDLAPALQRAFDRSPAAYFNAMPQSQVDRLDVWLDAGIRDFLNTAQITNALFHDLKERQPSASVFNDFDSLPGVTDGYIYYAPDYSRDAMGKITYLRYGDTEVCPSSDDVLGDGNHVGPDVVDRMFTLFSFMSARMPAQGRDLAYGGGIEDMESPTGRLQDFSFLSTFDSEVLGKSQEYGVLLPPDYYLPEMQEQGYPVLYFFHGQGMDVQGTTAIGLPIWPSMKESARNDRLQAGVTDLQRIILVFVDGNCAGDECWTGNFYADFEGLPSDHRRFEDAFFELQRHIEKTYRVKKPELIPVSELQ